MSLSQKHAGLILVPWFNSHEWHYVYRLAYSNERIKQLEALNLLKTWKLRTPILSTGIEGTLILLEALLLDTDTIPSEHITQLYAIALMRFLNQSAANSDKQGSFKETSAKNELPKWLINLRHDVAHGHHIPPVSDLKMGLNFGIGWLKEKYWEPQSKIITDYYIGEDSTVDLSLVDYLNVYVEMNMALFENLDFEQEYVKNVKDMIYKRLRKVVANPNLMLGSLLDMITQSLGKNIQNIRPYLENLVSLEGLLKPNFQIQIENDSNERINDDFKNIWQYLVNTFHQFGHLFGLINILFDVVGDIGYSNNCKKMAALWINELLGSLINLKKSGDVEGDPLKLEQNKYNYATEALNFEKRVLICHNDYSVYFLNSLVTYNSLSVPFIDDVSNLVKAKFEIDGNVTGLEDIYTFEDLKWSQMEEKSDSNTPTSPKSVNNTARIVAGPKWRKLNDTSMFKNCPLGVLPHQWAQKHPFLLVDKV